jgi:hypothetical protein
VTAGGARAGLGAARFDADDWFSATDPSCEAREAARIAERFEVEEDDRGIRIGLPVLQQIVARHVGLVADADERGQPDAAVLGEFEDRHAERAALRRQRDAACRRDDRRERSVHANRGVGVQDAHAIRADHPHPVGSHAVDQPLLQFATLGSGFGKAGGDDDQGTDTRGRALID